VDDVVDVNLFYCYLQKIKTCNSAIELTIFDDAGQLDAFMITEKFMIDV
jgi:hypothetical protein